MSRWPLPAVWFVLATAWAPLRAQQAPVFRSGVESVTVDVSVRQGNRPVSRLTAADFTITDEGVEQTVDALARKDLPIDLTMVLDVSGSAEDAGLDPLKRAVRDTARLLGPADRLRLLSVRRGIAEVFPFQFQATGQIPPIDDLAASRTTPLYDDIVAAMIEAAPADRRQLVIVYTDGRDTGSITSHDQARDVARRADAVMDIVVAVQAPRAQRAQAPIAPPASSAADSGGNPVEGLVEDFYAQLPAGNSTAGSTADALRDLASCTGGRVVIVNPRDSLGEAFKQLIGDFRAGYVLRYTPHGVRRGGWHDITVTVKKTGKYDVRARKGYAGE